MHFRPPGSAHPAVKHFASSASGSEMCGGVCHSLPGFPVSLSLDVPSWRTPPTQRLYLGAATRPRLRRLHRGIVSALWAFGARGPLGSVPQACRTTPPCAGVGLTRKCLMRCRTCTFSFQRFVRRTRPHGIRSAAGRLWDFLPWRRRQFDASPPRLRKPDSDHLLRRSRTMFALAHVLDLLAYKFTGLSRWRFGLLRAPVTLFLRPDHDPPPLRRAFTSGSSQ